MEAQATTKTRTAIKSAPARKTQAQRRSEAKAKILDAALSCFREHGYHATSMAQIAKAAGVSSGLLHYHFDHKENLGFAVWEKVMNDVFIEVTNQPRTPTRTRQAIRDIVDQLWQRMRDVAVLAPMTAQLTANAFDNPETRQRIGELVAEQHRLLAMGVEMLVPPGKHNMPHDAGEVAEMMMVVISGLLSALSLPGGPERVDRLYGTFRDLMLTYLLPDTP